MRTLSRLAFAVLLLAWSASLAQAQTTNLYTGSINAQVGFGVSLPFAGVHTEPGGPTQPMNVRGVGIPGPTAGAPGGAAVTTLGGFTLPPGDFFISTSYVAPTGSSSGGSVIASATSAVLSNRAGSFAPGFFTAAFGTSATVTFLGTGPNGAAGKAIFQPGPAGFGGVMPLAGILNNVITLQTPGLGISIANISVVPNFIGGSNVPTISTQSASFYNSAFSPPTTFLPIKISGFPWITGKVILTDTAPVVASMLTEIGVDERTITVSSAGVANATGTIKMVSGHMAHFAFVDDNVAEWEIKTTFLPEPSGKTLAVTGLLFVAALYARPFRNRWAPPTDGVQTSGRRQTQCRSAIRGTEKCGCFRA